MSNFDTANRESTHNASLLHVLQLHGEQFMQSFASGIPSDLQRTTYDQQSFDQMKVIGVPAASENADDNELESWSGMSNSTIFLIRTFTIFNL